MEPKQLPSNLQRLQQAGLSNVDYQFSDDDKAIIESLSSDEVDSLIEIADKLGMNFLNQHSGPTAGILF